MKKGRKQLGVVMAGLILATGVQALEGEMRVTPLVGYRMGGELENAETGAKHGMDESLSYGISLAFPFARDTYVELIYSLSEQDIDLGQGTTADFGAQYLQIGWLQYMQAEKLKPFVAPGVGWTHFSSDTGSVSSSDRLSLGFGFGADYQFTEHLGVRAAGRLYGTFTSGDSRAVYNGSSVDTVYSGAMMFQTDWSLGVVFVF